MAREGSCEEAFYLGDGEAQGRALRGADGSSFDGEQCVGVSRIGEALALVIRAAVAGNLLKPVEDPDARVGSHEDQIFADGGRWNGVVVAVEADPEGFGAAHGSAVAGVERMLGQGQQPWSLVVGEDFVATAGGVVGPGAGRGDLGAPAPHAGVDSLQGGEAMGGKEGLAQKADGALDAPLFVATGDVAGA